MKKIVQKEDPNHHMGKRTGYELIEGAYHIAPMYRGQFDAVLHKRRGVEDMIGSVTKFTSDTLAQLSVQKQNIWKEIIDDLGLDQNKVWLYDFRSGTVFEQVTPTLERRNRDNAFGCI
ncbi:hypothetical protein LCGC14_1423220 [marine sediment metagenome]|uniref:Uncharacterized protein n=1 Tax=marine sediment metagenome TaxID=412755 RepID=A0A0F9KBU2_9ZZZZ